MLRYLLLRLSYSLLVLWGVATLVFVLLHAAPASPAGHVRDKAAAAEERTAAFHLDRPLLTRYGIYINDLSPVGITTGRKGPGASAAVRIIRLHDSNFLSLKRPFLGRSFSAHRDVSSLLGAGLPGTLALSATAMLIALTGGLGFGLLASLSKDSAFDRSLAAAAVAGLSIPVFFVALIIALTTRYPQLQLKNELLPALLLSIQPMAMIFQIMRTAMTETLPLDFIRTGYAKGLSRTRVLLRHALPNALSPLLASLPQALAALLAGAFFVETILGWNGAGRIAVDAMEQHDLSLVAGAILLTALIWITIHLIADILRGLLDPRVRS